MPNLILLALAGLAAQLIDGSLGMAYGVTSTSLLLVVGLAPATASAAVHLAEVGTTLVSGAAHWRFGNVDWRAVARLGLPGAVGAFLGATVLSSISTEAGAPWMATILLVLGVYVLVRFTVRGPRTAALDKPLRSKFLAPLGVFAGFIDSTGGGGWGPVATPTLLAGGRMEPRKIIGTVDTSEFLVAIAASAGFLIGLGGEAIPWRVVGALLAGGLIAAPIAAYLVRVIPARMLGAAVGGLIVMTNVRTLFSTFDIGDAGRTAGYAGIALLWVAALAISVRAVLRKRQPEAAAA